MNDLVEWLRGQLDEDERALRVGVIDAEGAWWCTRCGGGFSDVRRLDDHLFAEHGGREWGPARMLAEVDAKRRVFDLHGPVRLRSTRGAAETVTDCRMCNHFPAQYPCGTLRLLALPYADRPGYQQEWAPGA